MNKFQIFLIRYFVPFEGVQFVQILMLFKMAIQVNLSRLSNLSLDWGGLDDNGLRRACPSHHLGSDHLWDGEGGQLGLGWSAGSRWSICSKDGQFVWRWSEGWSKVCFRTWSCCAFSCMGIWWISPVGVMICWTIWIPEGKLFQVNFIHGYENF